MTIENKPKKKKEKGHEEPSPGKKDKESEDSESDHDDFIISNPNKENPLKKAGGVPLSKKVKEQISNDKQERKQVKMLKEGKTAQAKADLAKLEEVRRKREEAKREKEEAEKLRKEKEAAAKGKKI